MPPPPNIPPPPIHEGSSDGYPELYKSCRLLGPTALVVQALLGILVILSLVLPFSRISRTYLG
jgi:hypothetical protein